MLDSETLVRFQHSKEDPRLSVSLKDAGVEVLLFFPESDFSGDTDVLEVRVLPHVKAVTPQALQHVGRRYSMYAQYAGATIKFDGADVRGTLATLRQAGKTSRGLSQDHYVLVAHQYNALVAEGHPYPVKALGEVLYTDISNASRWVKEAKRRGLI